MAIHNTHSIGQQSNEEVEDHNAYKEGEDQVSDEENFSMTDVQGSKVYHIEHDREETVSYFHEIRESINAANIGVYVDSVLKGMNEW